MAYFDKYGVEFSDDRKTLIKCPSDLQGEYAIPNGTINIRRFAFMFCEKLSLVSMPDSIITIGDQAFSNCYGLESITIPINVINIGRNAFEACINISSVFWNARRYDGNNYLSPLRGIYREKLVSVTLGKYVEEIPAYFCSGMSYLSTIKIPDSVVCIGENAFSHCTKLSDVIIGNGVRYIRKNAFCDCGRLKSINLPEHITKVERDAFYGCDNLISIFVPLKQEDRFYNMDGLKKHREIIQQIAPFHKYDKTKQRLINTQQIQEIPRGTFLFFDTETAGLPPKGKYDVPVTNPDFWPRLVQLAWILTDKEGRVLNRKSKIIYPNGFSIPASATAVHHITTEHAMQVGEPLRDVLGEFMRDLLKAEKIVCHNVKFDQHIVGAELYSMDMDYKALMDKSSICTMRSTTEFCAIPNPNSFFGGYKWPSLQELYHKLFNRDFEDAHDALADITATKDCFFELKRRGVIKE